MPGAFIANLTVWARSLIEKYGIPTWLFVFSFLYDHVIAARCIFIRKEQLSWWRENVNELKEQRSLIPWELRVLIRKINFCSVFVSFLCCLDVEKVVTSAQWSCLQQCFCWHPRATDIKTAIDDNKKISSFNAELLVLKLSRYWNRLNLYFSFHWPSWKCSANQQDFHKHIDHVGGSFIQSEERTDSEL